MPNLVHSLQFTVHRVKTTVNRQPKTVNWHLNRPGFTLIEIALFSFLLLALVSILYATSGTYLQSRNSSLQSTATKIASREIENLRKISYSSLSSLTSPSSFYDADLSKLPSSTATRTISNYQTSTKIKQINITITWVEGGASRQILIDTLISENGI